MGADEQPADANGADEQSGGSAVAVDPAAVGEAAAAFMTELAAAFGSLPAPATVRNWRTVTKLAELSSR